MSTALASCPDCGSSISPRAEDCPHCGAPIAVDITAAGILWAGARGYVEGVALAILALGVLAILGAWIS